MSDTGSDKPLVTGGVLDDMKRRAEEALAQRTEAAASVTPEERSVFEKAAFLLDGNTPGPVFISEPVGGRVYVCLVPRLGERLAAQAYVKRSSDANALEMLNDFLVAMSELIAATVGFFPENDEKSLATLRANISDRSKWPELQPADWLMSRSPYMEADLVTVYVAFKEWQKEVIPSREEMSKYYATAGSAVRS